MSKINSGLSFNHVYRQSNVGSTTKERKVDRAAQKERTDFTAIGVSLKSLAFLNFFFDFNKNWPRLSTRDHLSKKTIIFEIA